MNIRKPNQNEFDTICFHLMDEGAGDEATMYLSHAEALMHYRRVMADCVWVVENNEEIIYIISLGGVRFFRPVADSVMEVRP